MIAVENGSFRQQVEAFLVPDNFPPIDEIDPYALEGEIAGSPQDGLDDPRMLLPRDSRGEIKRTPRLTSDILRPVGHTLISRLFRRVGDPSIIDTFNKVPSKTATVMHRHDTVFQRRLRMLGALKILGSSRPLRTLGGEDLGDFSNGHNPFWDKGPEPDWDSLERVNADLEPLVPLIYIE